MLGILYYFVARLRKYFLIILLLQFFPAAEQNARIIGKEHIVSLLLRNLKF